MACCKCEEYGWNDPQSVVYTDPDDGNGYCLFHAPAAHKGMSVDEFHEQVAERIQAVIDLENEKALCDLSGAVFPGAICFESDSPLPKISFRVARFGGDADFGEASFEGFANFRCAVFEGGAVFLKAHFKRGVCFTATNFEKDAAFHNVCFQKNANFREASFDGYAFFHKASFGGSADFSSAQLSGPIRFESIETNDAILKFAYCAVSPSAMTFENCDPTCLDLVEQRDLTHIHFINASWERNGRIKACTEDESGRLQSTRDFYQRMKAKYKAENNEYEASKWHVAEKEAQLKLHGQNRESRFLWAMLWL